MYEDETPEEIQYAAQQGNQWPKTRGFMTTNRFAGLMSALITLGCLAIFFGFLHAESKRVPTVPLDLQVKILKIQKDQIAQSARFQMIQQAANEVNIASQKNTAELDRLKSEALKSTGLDPKKWDLSIEGEEIMFVEKKAPPETTTKTPQSPPAPKK